MLSFIKLLICLTHCFAITLCAIPSRNGAQDEPGANRNYEPSTSISEGTRLNPQPVVTNDHQNIHDNIHLATPNAVPEHGFGWAVRDEFSGNDFGHEQRTIGLNTQGSYYVLLPDGRRQRVNYYVTGNSGYVAEVIYEGEALFPTQNIPFSDTQDQNAPSRYSLNYNPIIPLNTFDNTLGGYNTRSEFRRRKDTIDVEEAGEYLQQNKDYKVISPQTEKMSPLQLLVQSIQKRHRE